MNGITLCVRNVGRLAMSPSQKTYKSSLMVSLNKRGQVHVDHPMDTNSEEYHRVVKEIVIPDCKEVVPDKDYAERIGQVISYINPAFHQCWNFSVEHVYRIVAPQEHQTKENLKEVRILRACCDLFFNMMAQIDDLSDNSSMRMGKPAWHTICEGGQWAGMYDCLVMGVMPFHIFKKHFRNHPAYTHMIEILGNVMLKFYIGENVDFLSLRKEFSVSKGDTGLNSYKAGHLFAIQPQYALFHAGVMDENVHQKVADVYIEFGNLVQVWDDFNDWYGSVDATGKPALDNLNGGKSWAVVTALQHFDSRQMALFKVYPITKFSITKDNLGTPAYNTRSKSVGATMLDKEVVPPSEAETITGPMGHSTHIDIGDESFTESEESGDLSANTHLDSILQGINEMVQNPDNEECHLTNDLEKRTAVKKLFDEIDLPQHYINHLREAYLRITAKIEAIPHTRVQKACYSHMEWMIGDACDPLPIL